MIPNIHYIRPKTIKEALSVLSTHRNDARILAGGTDIVPGFQLESSRFMNIKILVDIRDLKELKQIQKKEDHYLIGPAVNFTELGNHPEIRNHFPALSKAALSVGCLQIRNRATVGGNFINNAPCADSVPPLLIYDAKIGIRSAMNEKEMPLVEFLETPYNTRLQPEEMVTYIRLPIPEPQMKSDFYKLGRRRGAAISRISLALLADIREGVFRNLHIASGAVTPIGKRFYDIESFAQGKQAGTPLFKEISQELGRQILNITGLRWSTAYKLPVVQQCVYQLLESICKDDSTGKEVK